MDPRGGLYVEDGTYNNERLLDRSDQDEWTVSSEFGNGANQIPYIDGMTTDQQGNLYVTDAVATGPYTSYSRVRKRSMDGVWSILGNSNDFGPLARATDLVVDAHGNLYVSASKLVKRDSSGNWSVIADTGPSLGQVSYIYGMAVDPSGSLYVADNGRIEKLDQDGFWSVFIKPDSTLHTVVPGRFRSATGVAFDSQGNAYVSDNEHVAAGYWHQTNIQRRDTQGNWKVIARYGSEIGEINFPTGLVVDGSGRLIVSETSSTAFTGNNRIVRYDPALDTTPPFLLGDVNGDQKVNVLDAILVLRVAVGLLTPTDEQNASADMNGDGTVNVQDGILILQKSVGL